MSHPVSPVVARWELALRLRRRRMQVDVDVSTITRELGFTRNYWSAVENERKILSAENLTKLADLLEFDESAQQELHELHVAAKQNGWWTRYSAVIEDDVQRLFGLEYGASSIRAYESILIPGLLQTADYARALVNPDVNVRKVEVEQIVEARLKRQERLTGETPLHLTALVSEAALRQEIGGPSVLRRQLLHVADMVERHPETIDLRVIPFTVPACGLFGSATVNLIDFESAWLPTVIWQETVTSWGVVNDPTKVRHIAGTYREGLGRALSGPASLQFIRERVKELD